MNKLVYTTLILLAVANSGMAAKPDVAGVAARQAAINNVSEGLQAKQYRHTVKTAVTNSPFAPSKYLPEEPQPVGPVQPRSPQEFAETLAAQLLPTGVLMAGDNALLLFGEKKIKVGEMILITFDKQSYEVELIQLSRTTFTVRYKNIEITRSIKPAKQP